MAALTERQTQIRDLQKQGMKADEIGKALGITTNAVYQQIRRMRDSGSTQAKAKAGRQSKAGPRVTATPAAGTASTATIERPVTPLQAVRARRDLVAAGLKEAESTVAIAEKALEVAKAELAKVEERVRPELTQLEHAELVLKGELPVPSVAPKSGAKNGRTKASRAKAQETAQEPVQPTVAESTPAPDEAPQEPQDAPQAQVQATPDEDPFDRQEADAAQDASEAPQEPVAA